VHARLTGLTADRRTVSATAKAALLMHVQRGETEDTWLTLEASVREVTGTAAFEP
jgi:hypothetical protein